MQHYTCVSFSVFFFQINATDKDNNGINTFNYSLRFTDSVTGQYFAITPTTGALRIIKALDRDLPNGLAEFKFTVIVADSVTNPLFGYGSVTVRPIDINDNAPLFLPGKNNLTIEEGPNSKSLATFLIGYDGCVFLC